MCLLKPLPVTREVQEQKIWYKRLLYLTDWGGYQNPFWGNTRMFIGKKYTREQLQQIGADGSPMYLSSGNRLMFDNAIEKHSLTNSDYYELGIHCYRYPPYRVCTSSWPLYEKVVEVKVGQMIAYGEDGRMYPEPTGVFKSITLLRDVTELVKTGKLTG